MSREKFQQPVNPYVYVLHCIGKKWKMSILHEIFVHGKLHFNQTLRLLPVTEKVLSEQLKELMEDGLVCRNVNSDSYPPSIDYALTDAGIELMPVLDSLYVWGVRQMQQRNIPMDASMGDKYPFGKYKTGEENGQSEPTAAPLPADAAV